MKIINKSGKAEAETEGSFYILLVEGADEWEGEDFYFDQAGKFSSEEEAISRSVPGDAVAKVTIVAKIV